MQVGGGRPPKRRPRGLKVGKKANRKVQLPPFSEAPWGQGKVEAQLSASVRVRKHLGGACNLCGF